MSAIPFADVMNRFQVPGPVSRDFMVSEAAVSNLMGPLGSGKTTTCFMKGLLLSTCVPRSPIDGIRYAKGVVVRDTYPNLAKNTIETFRIQFPDEWGTFRGGSNGPGFSDIDFALEDGSILRQQIIFGAIGDTNVKTFCDGFEASWAMLNGVDALPADIITYMYSRLGRWPPPMHKPADWEKEKSAWVKLFGDMNAPDIDNWTYGSEENKKPGFVEHVPEGWKLFRQPGGLSTNAENLKNIGDTYYPMLQKNNASKKWWCKRFIENQFGFSQEGEPVYTNYDDERHVSKIPLVFNPQRDLLLGLDAGGRPAAVAAQRGILRRLRVLREFCPGRMGSRKFGAALSQWLRENFPDARILAYADPASADPTQDSDRGDDAEAKVWLETVADICGIDIVPAPTNLMGPRYEAVDTLLTEFIEGEPSLLIDPRCMVLRRGFNSGYRFGKTRRHGDEVLTNEVVDNDYTHPHDALQYVALGSCDYAALSKRVGYQRKTTKVVHWDGE
jgi:hypothetical protein